MKRFSASLKLVPWGNSEHHFLQVRSGSRLVAGVVFLSLRDEVQRALVRSFLEWANAAYVLYPSDVERRLKEMGYVDEV